MNKKKADFTPEEWVKRMAANRERNRRYLAKGDPDVKARRAAASATYLERLKSDPAYAEKAAERKAKAVQRAAKWAKENTDRVKSSRSRAMKANPAREAAKVQRRNAAKIQALPAWADMSAICQHYKNARHLTDATGHAHHVDHIIPLRHPMVCGLHVQNNLRATPSFLNLKKGNNFDPDVLLFNPLLAQQ